MQAILTKTKTSLEKIVRLGRANIHDTIADVFCKITIKDGNLSIVGVEGPKANGNCIGACGQIDMPEIIDLAPGWNGGMLSRFWAVWERWHLNNMRAGSPAQEQYLRDNPILESEYAYPKNHYDVACKKLADAGLNPDNGYSYGDAWNFEELPDDVIEFLSSLPDTDKIPAWV